MTFAAELVRIRRLLSDPAGNVWGNDLLEGLWNEVQQDVQLRTSILEDVAVVPVPPRFQSSYMHECEREYAGDNAYRCLFHQEGYFAFTAYFEVQEAFGVDGNATTAGAAYTHPLEAWYATPAYPPRFPLPGNFGNAKGLYHDEEPVPYVERRHIEKIDPSWRSRSGLPNAYTRESDEDNQFLLYPKPSTVVWNDISSGVTIDPEGVEFDGTSDYLTRGGGLTGAADGKKGLISFWFRSDQTTARDILTAKGGGNGASILIKTGYVAIAVDRAGGAGGLSFRTPDNIFTDNSQHHVMASWDTEDDSLHLYFDGVSALGTITTQTNNVDLDFTSATDWVVGGNMSFEVARLWDGGLAQLYYNIAEYLDLSVAANREKLIKAGQPVYLGSDGSGPTGTAPILLLDGGVTDYATNVGTGGDFTVVGELGTPDPLFFGDTDLSVLNPDSMVTSVSGDTTGSELGIITQRTGNLLTDESGFAVDVLDAVDNVLIVYDVEPTEVDGVGSTSDFPAFLTKYIRHGVLARAYQANTDGNSPDMAAWWGRRYALGLTAIATYQGKRTRDRNRRYVTQSSPATRRRVRHPRLPDAYPAI